MGWYDYLSDLTSSLTLVGTAHADASTTPGGHEGPSNPTGEDSDAKDTSDGGMGTAQHRGATTQGGASLSSPAAGTDEESGSEKEANEADAEKQQAKQGESAPGHKPGDGGDASGQVGAKSSGPHGGPTKAADDDEEEEADEDEEEEEDEPVDPKVKLEEDCMRSQKCAPLKHHYDECAERVTEQHEQHGKAHEDCVEEFFHLMHCASQCAAPKLFKQL
ncbi:hypothetical protein BAUCODRAFT_32556, partial [Baudoinia panamericana UAMH 10762]